MYRNRNYFGDGSVHDKWRPLTIQETLDELSEILEKYKNKANILLGGDIKLLKYITEHRNKLTSTLPKYQRLFVFN
jgi:hypothetical protein